MFERSWWKEVGCKEFGTAVWIPAYGLPPNDRKLKTLKENLQKAVKWAENAKQRAKDKVSTAVVLGQDIQKAKNLYKKLGNALKDPKKKKTVREAFDKHWPAETTHLTAQEQKELKRALKDMTKPKRVEWQKNQDLLKQVALLQYCPANEEEDMIHYWKAKVLDPKQKRKGKFY